MAKKKRLKGRQMSAKPKELGYKAMEKVDAAQMANSQVMFYLSSILTNELTTVEVVKAIGLAIKEASEVQKELIEVKYLGK